MREIIFDTETTGFDPFAGDRLIEIGALEMEHKVLTGRQFHFYINPENKIVSEGAFRVHGLDNEFLKDKPLFSHIAKDFIDFVAEGQLVAHNADFDMKFINWELQNAGFSSFPKDKFTDTLALARHKFPGAQNSLDALCRRFDINNSHRTLHGALLDSEILAEVYIELIGGKQTGLEFVSRTNNNQITMAKKSRPRRQAYQPPTEERAHADFIKTLKKPIWLL